MVNNDQKSKKGAVSIFVVIFSTILIAIIALGFVRLMMLDQQRAINSDLADSAYDSALTGIEDAKRAILAYERTMCGSGVELTGSVDCKELRERYLTGENCDAVQGILGGEIGKEVQIVTNKGSDKNLEQAYTCVKIRYYTDNYEREISKSGEQIMLPLNATSSFNSMILKWSSESDAGFVASGPSGETDVSAKSSWPRNSDKQVPALMLQYIDGGSEPRTVFLNPDKTTGFSNITTVSFETIDKYNVPTADGAIEKNMKPPIAFAKCEIRERSYECRVKLEFPNIDAGDQAKFLKVTKLYSAGAKFDFRLEGNGVRFNGIQPEIDSTGRANYVFRRLKARVEFTGGLFPYPNAALSVEGDICKAFEVTERRVLKNGVCY